MILWEIVTADKMSQSEEVIGALENKHGEGGSQTLIHARPLFLDQQLDLDCFLSFIVPALEDISIEC